MRSAEEIAKELRDSEEWIAELCRELVEMVGFDWETIEAEDVEDIIYEAAERLGVEV